MGLVVPATAIGLAEEASRLPAESTSEATSAPVEAHSDTGSPAGPPSPVPLDLVWPAAPPSAAQKAANPDSAYGLLIEMAKSKDEATRRAAAKGLAAGGGAEGIVALLNSLADNSPEVRDAALAALAKAPADAVFDRVMAILVEGTAQEVANLDPALPRLRELLEEKMKEVLLSPEEPEPRKSAAAFCLGRIRSTSAAQVLEELCWSGEPRLAMFSSAALASLHDPNTAEALATLLQHSEPSVRWNAVVGLGQLGGPVAVKALSDLVTRDREDRTRIRQAAVTVLGQIGGPAVVPVLVQSMQVNMNVRHEACAALRRLTGVELRDEPTAWAMWYAEVKRMQEEVQQAPPLVPAQPTTLQPRRGKAIINGQDAAAAKP